MNDTKESTNYEIATFQRSIYVSAKCHTRRCTNLFEKRQISASTWSFRANNSINQHRCIAGLASFIPLIGTVGRITHLAEANQADRLRFTNEPAFCTLVGDNPRRFTGAESTRRSASFDNAKSSETKPRRTRIIRGLSSCCSHGFPRFVRSSARFPTLRGSAAALRASVQEPVGAGVAWDRGDR